MIAMVYKTQPVILLLFHDRTQLIRIHTGQKVSYHKCIAMVTCCLYEAQIKLAVFPAHVRRARVTPSSHVSHVRGGPAPSGDLLVKQTPQQWILY